MSERTVPDEYGSKFYKNSAHGGGSAARAAVETVTPTLLVVACPATSLGCRLRSTTQPAISAKPTRASVIHQNILCLRTSLTVRPFGGKGF